MAFWLPVTLPELAPKVALLWPGATVTLAGTESNPLLLASETKTALVAAVFNLTVQVAEALPVNAEGAQASEVSCAGAFPLVVSVKVWEPPFRLAVSRAVWLEVRAATVAVKAALLSPEPMLTLPGTVTLELLLDKVTFVELEATAVRVAVQVAFPGAFIVAGEQVKLLSCTAAPRLIVACWLWPLSVAVTTAL
jgi:hypothetical protein